MSSQKDPVVPKKAVSREEIIGYLTEIRNHSNHYVSHCENKKSAYIGAYVALVTAILSQNYNLNDGLWMVPFIVMVAVFISLGILNQQKNQKEYSNRVAATYLITNDVISGSIDPEKLNIKSGEWHLHHGRKVMPVFLQEASDEFAKDKEEHWREVEEKMSFIKKYSSVIINAQFAPYAIIIASTLIVLVKLCLPTLIVLVKLYLQQ